MRANTCRGLSQLWVVDDALHAHKGLFLEIS
jgi:hypothetical protein